MTVNEFDQLDRPIWTDYDYPGSGQDETILHLCLPAHELCYNKDNHLGIGWI